MPAKLSVRKILVLAANPSDTVPLDLAGEVRGNLRRHLYALRDYPELAERFRQGVSHSRAVEIAPDEAFKLESIGLIHLESNLARPRCEVYREYFQEYLEG